MVYPHLTTNSVPTSLTWHMTIVKKSTPTSQLLEFHCVGGRTQSEDSENARSCGKQAMTIE
jgi:hypothetical protein